MSHIGQSFKSKHVYPNCTEACLLVISRNHSEVLEVMVWFKIQFIFILPGLTYIKDSVIRAVFIAFLFTGYQTCNSNYPELIGKIHRYLIIPTLWEYLWSLLNNLLKKKQEQLHSQSNFPAITDEKFSAIYWSGNERTRVSKCINKE